MRIRRSRPTRDFVQVPNATARDDRLSHMARGILLDILSRPAGWDTTADEMWRQSFAKHGKEGPGRRAFRAAFAELKTYGYITASREVLSGGRQSTVLTVSDVPHAGTPVPPAQTQEIPGRTDVPHAGTSENGTSAPPAQTPIPAGHSDVPPCGTSVPPGQTSLFAGHSDVPHAGTSKRENGEVQKTGLNTTTRQPSASRDLTPEEMAEFGRFWLLYPKSRNRDRSLALFAAAVTSGADPKAITAAAVAYAKEKAGAEWRYISASDNWLRDGRYEDDYAPDPAVPPKLRSIPGRYQPHRQPDADAFLNQQGF